jgi:hypothetical protein
MRKRAPRTEGEKTRLALAVALRERDRKRLEELATALSQARTRKREAVLGVRQLCRTERERLKAAADLLRRESRAMAATRREVRGSCQVGRELTRAGGRHVVELARDASQAEREHQRRERRYEKTAKAGPTVAKGRAGGRRAAELRAESDDAVEQSIDPSLLPLWRRIRHHIKATARRTRTEAFLEWVHDHPEAHYELAEAQGAEELRRLEAEHAAHAAAIRRPGRYRRSASELAAAPF